MSRLLADHRMSLRSARTAESNTPAPALCKVEEVMTRDVLTLRPDTSLQTAAELIFERGYGGAPVVDADGNLVGVLSKTDLLGDKLSELSPAEVVDGQLRVMNGATVADLMSRAPVAVVEGTPLSEVASVLTRLHLHRLPVVSKAGAVIGVVSSTDLVRWMAGLP